MMLSLSRYLFILYIMKKCVFYSVRLLRGVAIGAASISVFAFCINLLTVGTIAVIVVVLAMVVIFCLGETF